MLLTKSNRDPVSIEENLPQNFGGSYLDARRYATDYQSGKSPRPSDDREVWSKLERAAASGSAVSERDCMGRAGWLVIQWQIPEALDLMSSLYKNERGYDPVKGLGEALVVSGRGDSFEASTVTQFMKDHFGSTRVLEVVQSTLRKKGHPIETSSSVRHARASDKFIIFNFGSGVDERERNNVTRAIRWLAKAVRPNLTAQAKPSEMPDGSWIRRVRSKSSKPIADTVQAEIARRESIYPDESPRVSRSVDKVLSKSMDVQSSMLTYEKLNNGNARCWLRLFRSAIIADFEIQHPAGMKGLKVDFKMMCQLAGIENITRFIDQSTKKEAYFPVGFFTALGPVAMSGNRIQWHLYESQTFSHGDDLGFTRHKHVDLTRRDVKGLMKHKFECYLGWAKDVEILLGTQMLDARKMGWSGLREKRRRQEVTGTSYSLNFSFKAGINFGGGMSRSYRTVSTLQRFDNKDANFAKAIPHACVGNAVVYDSTTDRAWLVPKLSLLLHLAHFYYYQFQSLNDNRPSPVPFAQPDYDGGAAAAVALRNKGDVVLFSFGEADEDKRALRNVLLDLSLNLANSPLVGQKVGRRYLYASELAGLVAEPDAGLPYTEVSKPAWAILVEFFDAIGVCSQLGTAIRPVISGQPRTTALCKCDDLATGKQVLGASMICVADLLKRRNFFLPQLLDREVQIVQDVWWRYNPYVPCNHQENYWRTPDGKSKKDNYQHLTKLRKEYGKLSIDQKKRLFSLSQKGNLQSSGQPYERGAIVFGKEDGWFVKMVDKVTGSNSRPTNAASSSSQNLPVRLHEGDGRRMGSRESSVNTIPFPVQDRESDSRRAGSREGSISSRQSSDRRYDPRLDSRGSSSSQYQPGRSRDAEYPRGELREASMSSQSLRDRGRQPVREGKYQDIQQQRDNSRSTSSDRSIRSNVSSASYQSAMSQMSRSDASRRGTPSTHRPAAGDTRSEISESGRSERRRGLGGLFSRG